MTKLLKDLPAARKASTEAQAKVKAENAAYQVEVIDYTTGKCIKTIPCESERAADRVDRGVQINLNHERYYTRIAKAQGAKT